MGEHAKIRNIPDLLSWAAYEDIDEGLFKEASQTILSIVRAFKYESKLEGSLSICLNGLSYDDYIVFVKELVKEIELTQKIIDHFDRSDQAERVNRFTAFLLSSLRGMAESLLRLKKWKDAITVLKEALTLKPNDSDIVALLGRAYLEDENLEKSKTISQTDKVIKDRGRAIERQSRPTGADITVEVKEKSGDEFASRKIAEAKSLIEQGKQSEAIECLDETLIFRHDDEELQIRIGVLYLLLEEFDKALSIFKRLNEIFPEDSRTLNYLGDSYKHLGQYEKAEKIFKRAYELNPTQNVISYNLGCVYCELNQFQNGKYFLEKAKESSPDDLLILTQLSVAYIKLQLFQEAVEVLEHLNKSVPKDINFLNGLGTMYLFTNQYEQSIRIFEEYNEFRPDDPRVLMKLGIAYLNLKQYKNAKYTLKNANFLEPDNLIGLSYLGLLYLITEQYQEAKNSLEKANKLKPDESTTLVNLAKSYYELGHIDKSKIIMGSAYEFDKDNSEIKRNLEIVLGRLQGELSYLYPKPDILFREFSKDLSLN